MLLFIFCDVVRCFVYNIVSRIVGRGENYDMDLVLDINSQIYRLPTGQKFNLLLAKTLNLDGSPDNNEWNYNQHEEASLMDGYEYVMHGKVFKVQQASNKDAKM